MMKRTENILKSTSRATEVFEEKIVEQLRTEKLILHILIVFSSSGSDKKSYKCVECTLEWKY